MHWPYQHHYSSTFRIADAIRAGAGRCSCFPFQPSTLTGTICHDGMHHHLARFRLAAERDGRSLSEIKLQRCASNFRLPWFVRDAVSIDEPGSCVRPHLAGFMGRSWSALGCRSSPTPRSTYESSYCTTSSPPNDMAATHLRRVWKR